MKHWHVHLAMLVAVSASTVLAEDFKTINGKVYKDATITRVEPDGIVVKTNSGVIKLYFSELPKDVQERFHPGFATATGNAVTQRIDGAESAPDRFAQKVERIIEERESILKGKHTPGPAELGARREINFHWVFLAVTAIVASVLFAIVWRRFN